LNYLDDANINLQNSRIINFSDRSANIAKLIKKIRINYCKKGDESEIIYFFLIFALAAIQKYFINFNGLNIAFRNMFYAFKNAMFVKGINTRVLNRLLGLSVSSWSVILFFDFLLNFLSDIG
jgi:hypothetical protein